MLHDFSGSASAAKWIELLELCNMIQATPFSDCLALLLQAYPAVVNADGLVGHGGYCQLFAH
jgi:hypothetical protein